MRKRLSYISIITVFFLSASLEARPQTEKLVDLFLGQFSQMVEVMSVQMRPMFQSAHIPQEQQKQFFEEFASQKTKNRFKRRLVKIYEDALTEEQIKESYAFFSSKTGQAFLKKQPQITEASSRVGQEIGLEIAKRFLESQPKTSAKHHGKQ